MTQSATVEALFVYPVKSCRGIAVDGAPLSTAGLEHDREWMVVDAEGRFITQRTVPRLALVRTRLGASSLRLDAEGFAPIEIEYDRDGASRRVVVWRDTVDAIDQGDAVAAWLSTALGTRARLVRFAATSRRLCNPTYAGDTGAHTRFADAYPLLVVSAASLRDLNTRLDEPLPMNRFRPNIVLADVEPYEEDHMAELVIGECILKLVKPSTRCQITTTDQDTAVVGVEPLPTLARYRMNPALEGVTFGMNAVVTAGDGARIVAGATARYMLAFD